MTFRRALHCPRCGSTHARPVRRWRVGDYVAALVTRRPGAVPRERWGLLRLARARRASALRVRSGGVLRLTDRKVGRPGPSCTRRAFRLPVRRRLRANGTACARRAPSTVG